MRLAKPYLNDEDMALAEKMFEEGHSYRSIGLAIDMSRDRVAALFRDRLGPRAVGRTPEQYALETRAIAKAMRDRDERREKYAREYDDPNVRFFGDPPFHRSALAQKLNKEANHV